MEHRTSSGCCEKEIGSSKAHIPQLCKHGELFVYTKQLKRTKPMRRVSEKREGETRRRGSTLKRGRGFAVTEAQRRKIRDRPCIVSGQDHHEATIHPAHLWDRGRGGCDDPLCVVPLRADLHRLYDEKKLDILPALLTGGYYAELAHIIEAHQVSLTTLLERVTGHTWHPIAKSERSEVAA